MHAATPGGPVVYARGRGQPTAPGPAVCLGDGWGGKTEALVWCTGVVGGSVSPDHASERVGPEVPMRVCVIPTCRGESMKRLLCLSCQCVPRAE